MNKDSLQDISVDDPYRIAKQMVEELRGKADIIVCLSDLGMKGDQILAKEVKDFHFILGGHDGLHLKEPIRTGNTLIFQHYRKGMYVGRIDLTIVGRDFSFQDSGIAERLTRELEGINERIHYTERMKRSPAIENYLKGLYQRRSELEGKLVEARKNPPKASRFLHRSIPLGDHLPEHREWKSIVSGQGVEK